MTPPPPSDPLVDPNERLLASVIPPPPPTLRVRVGLMAQCWPNNVLNIIRWSGSHEGRNCFLAALAGAGMVLGFYRSEASSAASPAVALEPPGSSSTLTERSSLRSEPRALAPTPRDVSSSPSARLLETTGSERSVPSSAVERTEHAPRAAIESGSSRAAQQRVSSSKKLGKKKIEKRKIAKRRVDRKKQKAKRASVARAPHRAARRAKSQRATTPEPLSSWLAKQARSEPASVAESR